MCRKRRRQRAVYTAAADGGEKCGLGREALHSRPHTLSTESAVYLASPSSEFLNELKPVPSAGLPCRRRAARPSLFVGQRVPAPSDTRRLPERASRRQHSSRHPSNPGIHPALLCIGLRWSVPRFPLGQSPSSTALAALPCMWLRPVRDPAREALSRVRARNRRLSKRCNREIVSIRHAAQQNSRQRRTLPNQALSLRATTRVVSPAAWFYHLRSRPPMGPLASLIRSARVGEERQLRRFWMEGQCK